MSWLISGGIFLVLIMFWRPGESAVRCYLCSTAQNETACLYPKSYDMPIVQCDQTALQKTRELAKQVHIGYDRIFEVDTHAMARNIDLDCLKVVTKFGTKKYTIRGCQLAEQTNLDICYKMKTHDTDYLKQQHCSRCSRDLCNSAIKYKRVDVLLGIIVTYSIVLGF